jgi:hemoglobin-like flavoprotein
MSLVSEPYLELFHDSFQRCREREDFFDIFYKRFLSSSDDITNIFKDVDVEHVKKMVKDALFIKLMASDGSAFGAKKLMSLGVSHDRYGVRPEHYQLWLDALMSTVEETDPRYDINIDRAWREVMQIGIDIMQHREVVDE